MPQTSVLQVQFASPVASPVIKNRCHIVLLPPIRKPFENYSNTIPTSSGHHPKASNSFAPNPLMTTTHKPHLARKKGATKPPYKAHPRKPP